MRGAFALVYLFEGKDDLLIGARQGAPLAVGYGEGEMYLGSDALALAPFTDRIAYLEEGDWVVATRSGADIRDASGAKSSGASSAAPRKPARREGQLPPFHGQGDPRAAGGRRPYARPLRRHGARCGSSHSPGRSTRATLAATLDRRLRHRVYGGPDRQILDRALRPAAGRDRRRLRIPLPRDAGRPERPDDLHFAIRRDSRHPGLAALRKDNGSKTVGVVNVPASSIARLTDAVAPTLAGPEIGVASTKAFTCQLAAMAALAISLGRARGTIDEATEAALLARTDGDSRTSWPRR